MYCMLSVTGSQRSEYRPHTHTHTHKCDCSVNSTWPQWADVPFSTAALYTIQCNRTSVSCSLSHSRTAAHQHRSRLLCLLLGADRRRIMRDENTGVAMLPSASYRIQTVFELSEVDNRQSSSYQRQTTDSLRVIKGRQQTGFELSEVKIQT